METFSIIYAGGRDDVDDDDESEVDEDDIEEMDDINDEDIVLGRL